MQSGQILSIHSKGNNLHELWLVKNCQMPIEGSSQTEVTASTANGAEAFKMIL